MQDVIDKIQQLENRSSKVITYCKKLEEQYQGISTEKQKLESIIAQQEQQIKTLEEKNKVVKLAGKISGQTDDKASEIKLKINELVREIDKCIGMLNK